MTNLAHIIIYMDNRSDGKFDESEGFKMNRDLEDYMEELPNEEFFSRFTTEEMTKIKEESVIHQYRKGQILFFQADPKRYSFFLLKGLIRLEKADSNDEYLYFDYIKGHSFFPYGGVFGQHDYTHSAIAMTDIDLLLIPNKLIESLVAQNTNQLRYMYGKISEILVFHETRLQLTAISSAVDRVIQSLSLWMIDMGTVVGETTVIPYPLTINELAVVAGTTRETAGKVVRDLTSQGLIDFNRRRITIFDRSYFEKHIFMG
ncbi:Crp/Fnr family transcriptional regulator [Vaginisenegalia massiliensis]|uniref:Crp/Fnr family transcriptional regulator n=1 Tax=Vaginisenegalia massiliensis TaxID=2058294 RepID=UPI001F15223C|nr:Crp/Fnr family transcriptional regulator [Vaginisenegalia massiliensis]